MSALKNIVFFSFFIQGAFLIVNHTEITPGVLMNTGQFGTIGGIDFVTVGLSFLGNVVQSLTNTLNGICGGSLTMCNISSLDFWTAGGQLINALTNFVLFLLSLILIIMQVIYGATVGWVPFFIYLFEYLDPGTAYIYGTVLGGGICFVVLWGCTEFLPTTSNEEA